MACSCPFTATLANALAALDLTSASSSPRQALNALKTCWSPVSAAHPTTSTAHALTVAASSLRKSTTRDKMVALSPCSKSTPSPIIACALTRAPAWWRRPFNATKASGLYGKAAKYSVRTAPALSFTQSLVPCSMWWKSISIVFKHIESGKRKRPSKVSAHTSPRFASMKNGHILFNASLPVASTLRKLLTEHILPMLLATSGQRSMSANASMATTGNGPGG
mmetsp:Transcript_13370/g.35908  ORF Transcript_13370/g.35908 Transcript_13370/m.35908 type:complete len:222 (-) Transcript_13370:30-695(-)